MAKPKTTKLVAGKVTYELDPTAGTVTAICTGEPSRYGSAGGMVELLLFSVLEELQLLRGHLTNTGIANPIQQVPREKPK